jgi:hypothetical protein
MVGPPGGAHVARAFSGEVKTGSPQKMRLLKDNWSVPIPAERNSLEESSRERVTRT